MTVTLRNSGQSRPGLRLALKSLTHSAAYARALVRGNYLPGDMAWSRPGSPPVVLAHGFLGTRGTMVPLRKRFEQDGRVVFTYHHGTFQLRSMRASAQELVEQLERLSQSLGCARFDVVGFSMGGLVALHAVKFLQAQRYVRRLALLGTPTGGSWASLLGVATIGLLCPSIWQCLPPSDFLEDLREAPLPPGVKVRQIHASHDVLCPRSGPIAGVDAERDHIVLPGGHSSLVMSRSFYLAQREFFDAPDPAAATSVLELAAE